MSSHSPCIPVVLCGGEGSRLWPLSRAARPKPFVRMPDGRTLLEQSLMRAMQVAHDRLVIVTQRDFMFSVLDGLSTVRQILGYSDGAGPFCHLLLEPEPRNTAAAIAAATVRIRESRSEEASMLVLTADHDIAPMEAFLHDTESALAGLATGHPVMLFGIPPRYPESGYGYILRDREGRRVTGFVEKPDVEQAQQYIREGALWNSGMFVMAVNTAAELFEKWAPSIWSETRHALEQAHVQTLPGPVPGEAVMPSEDVYRRIPELPFDRAVVERTDHLGVVEVSFQWRDVGSWKSLAEEVEPDEAGNRIFKASEQAHWVTAGTTRNNFIWMEADRPVALCGVSDLIVADMPDALLVTTAEAAQHVGTVYRQLKEAGHSAALESAHVLRPWGEYVVLYQAGHTKVKRIRVEPGQRLSYQSHRYRSEHWIIVRGKADVILEGVRHHLTVNESIFIDRCQRHRLINPGNEPLEVIEVQYGSYLGEDDIERHEDDYFR